MTKTFGEALKEKLIELSYPQGHSSIESSTTYPLPILGCTQEEINEIRQLQGVNRLPKIYEEFLSYMGKRSGDLFRGYDIVYRYLISSSFKEWANKILVTDGHNPLSEDEFSFMNLQGHSYWYFSTLEDDPAVFLYVLDHDDPESLFKNGGLKIDDSLSEFLTRFIAERQNPEAQREFLTKYANKI